MFAKGRFAVSLYSRKYSYLTHNSSDFHLIYVLYGDMCAADSRFHQINLWHFFVRNSAASDFMQKYANVQ